MASRFAVATGTWDASNTSIWSATSGGASGASAPTAADDVFFNAASGSITVTIATGATALTVDCTGFTGTWTQNAMTLAIAGNLFKLAAGMTYAPAAATRIINFTSTSGTCLITCAGKSFGAVTLTGAGGTFQAQDAFAVIAAGSLTLTNGTFDGNGQTVSVGQFSSNNSNTRSILMGGGTWTLSGTGTIWTTATTTNLTFTKGASNISVSGTSTVASSTFTGGGLTFNGITIASPASATSFQLMFGSAVRFSSLTQGANPRAIGITNGTTLTIDTAPTTLTGSATQRFVMTTNSAGSTGTLSVPSGTVAMDTAALRDIICTGGATFTATNSTDLYGNSGITITPPASGGGYSFGAL